MSPKSYRNAISIFYVLGGVSYIVVGVMTAMMNLWWLAAWPLGAVALCIFYRVEHQDRSEIQDQPFRWFMVLWTGAVSIALAFLAIMWTTTVLNT